MDTLAEYSSDEDSQSPLNSSPPVECLDSEEVTTSECTNNPGFESKSDEISSLLPYSQEYSMNRRNLITAFPYLPWTPSQQVRARLCKVGDVALESVRGMIKDFDERYIYNSNVSQKAVVHGHFGHSNSKSFTALHVSLFPNFQSPMHKIRPLTKNLQRSIRSIEVPQSIITKKKANVLDAMISGGVNPQQKQITLRVSPRVQIYFSSKTGGIFIGLEIVKWLSTNKLSDEFHYLVRLSQAINEQADISNVNYRWMQFGVSEKDGKPDMSSMKYHASIVVCELRPSGKRLTGAEFLQLRESLMKLEISHLLKDIQIECDALKIYVPGQVHSVSLI